MLSIPSVDIINVAYHDFAHATANDEVCAQLVKDIGDARVLLLRNHGEDRELLVLFTLKTAPGKNCFWSRTIL